MIILQRRYFNPNPGGYGRKKLPNMSGFREELFKT
jgi:hypothetical protein